MNESIFSSEIYKVTKLKSSKFNSQYLVVLIIYLFIARGGVGEGG